MVKSKQPKRNKSTSAKNKDSSYNKVLKWLSQFQSTNECLTTILKFVKVEKHETIRLVTAESIKDYMCGKASSAALYKKLILNKLNKDIADTDLADLVQPLFSNFDNAEVSESFLNKYRICKASRFCLDVLVHRKVIFNCQIEVSDWQSTYISSTQIRKLLYTILIKKFTLEAGLGDSG
jgi:hypothetical protein